MKYIKLYLYVDIYINIYIDRYITYDYMSKTVKHGFWISKTIYAKI